MTYINDIPSALLMQETNTRLRELGCAVTADRDSAKKERQSGKVRASLRSRSATGASFQLGSVHADE
ncbi:MAG TPA: hypothetical protein VN538_07885 [Clostridia bacterium]|nr:hypothetical protein [Clostridia bacterium]